MIVLWFSQPYGPMNVYGYYIGSNPSTSFNPVSTYPRIARNAFLSPFSVVIGDILIQSNVFVGPFVSVRADEGTPFYIGKNSNLQDGVILHGLRDQYVEVNKRKFSIYIGEEVTCAHDSLIHGPCKIENRVFIGFKSIVIHAIIGEGSFISSNVVITNGVKLKPKSFVPPGAYIDTQEKADALTRVPLTSEEFAKEVQRVNQEFPVTYSLYFGKNRCSCGLAF